MIDMTGARRVSLRRMVFQDNITHKQLTNKATRMKKTPEELINELNKRREEVGKPPLFPNGSFCMIDTRKLIMPTEGESAIIQTMENRSKPKGKYKNMTELADEMGLSIATVAERLAKLEKKGYPIEQFFSKKSMKEKKQ